jgi:hypothetical protein
MSFDQKTRNLLQRTVTSCRRILDTEFAAQRREIFGINDDGSTAPLETLAHLPDEDMQVARLLRQRLEHLAAGLVASGKKQSEALKESVGRLTREQAFTVLNRLAALRMAERREIVLECVRNGAQSEGFLLFLQSAGSAFGGTFQAYRTYLSLLCDELSLDLGSLFSRWDPMALLSPRKDALEAILGELNGTGSAASRDEITKEAFNDLWLEDETVGWIYQYYNDETERKQMRLESSAPRNSRELAVRNQFFTPRYVVEFLTDNTLGRIWYEMTQGDTTLKEQCRYLVRRPTEIFLKAGGTPPKENQEQSTKNEELSQEALLKQPVHIPHRPLKDPRTILMIDPACGSMHFGLYAFDLFEVIYQEAWELEQKLGPDALIRPKGMKSLHDTYAGKDTFLKDVPRLIIEHNLHGIDIDPRCAQIAGLSLWLRAQKAWQRLGLKPAERPAIKRSNIVCAEPMPGEKELLREFVEREFPATERAVCLRLLEAIFDKMQLAGEAGSLLKIEEEIRSAIEDARDAWQKLATKPPELFTTTELNQISTAPELTGLEQAVSSLTTDPRHLSTDFWERIEERIYAALRDYAEQAENGGGFQRRLFAEDAARGFAFIDVCRKRYDVALMNPPFGVVAKAYKLILKAAYPESWTELGTAFIERIVSSIIQDSGLVGVLTSKTWMFLPRFAPLRANLFNSGEAIRVLVDIGSGVLDGAAVSTCATIVSRQAGARNVFLSLRGIHNSSRDKSLLDAVNQVSSALPSALVFTPEPSWFRLLPLNAFAYWVSASAIKAIGSNPKLSTLFEIRPGLTTLDNDRFVRAWIEVPPSGLQNNWNRFTKGGSYSPFFQDTGLALNWRKEGAELKAKAESRGGETKFIASQDFYGRKGLSYPQINKAFNARLLPNGFIFSNKSICLFPKTRDVDLFATLAYLNSTQFQYFMLLGSAGRTWEKGIVAECPSCPQLGDVEAQISVRAIEQARRLASVIDEAGCLFTRPLVVTHPSISAADKELARMLDDSARDQQIAQKELDKRVAVALGFSVSREAVDELLHASTVESSEPDETHDTDDEDNASVSQKDGSHEQLLSYGLGAAFGRWDIRYATGEQAAPELPDPFAPLPVCPPGQLQNAQGLPARPEDVPAAYPVRIPWDGILVDDPNHPLDIERRVREVIEIIWSGQEGGPTAEAIEHEACEILGVKSLRDYFRKPAGFFAGHLKRYSKSRRQAPIYWPLSTASGSYTLWIYYHRLTPDTLFKVQQQFLEPKLKTVEEDIHRLRTMLANNEGGAKERSQLEKLETLSDELKEMHAEIEHWAKRWKPNLNDGVLITACPLWKLFRLPKWRKDLEACWKELERGDYDWAHLALSLWPEHVRKVCETDRSIAIAHGLESLCKIEARKPKAPRGRKKNTPAETSLEEEKPML